MYTRGQFAIIGKVGRKALRIYDEEGLLVPASVNGENGYHYYDDSQLAVLEKIKSLRKIGLSLFEIKQVLDGKACEKNLIDSKIKEMDLHLKEVKEFVSSSEKENIPSKINEPDIRPFEKCKCIYVSEKIETTGNHFVIYENLSEDNFSMKTCLPVNECKDENAMEVFEKKCLHLNFSEGFSKVGKAHVQIKKYAESQKINLTGKTYEIYNKDMSVDVFYPIG